MGKYDLKIPQDRIDEAIARRKAWLAGEPLDRLPFEFAVTGAPKTYTQGEQAADPDKAVEAAITVMRHQFEQFPDNDYIPFFRLPFLGEGVIPSMFGAKQKIVENNPPFTEGRVMADMTELDKLPKRIDPENDGWGPRIKECVTKFLDATDGRIPVGVTDHQSPYGIATKIVENEALMLGMYDTPELVREMLDICMTATIDVIRALEEWAGDPDLIVKNYRAPYPGGGLIIWDDYVSVMSPSLHQEFCLEPNMRLYEEFGIGHLHTCGPYFPGYIDAILAHKPLSVDVSIMRGMTKSRDDMLQMRDLCDQAGVKICGNLTANPVHTHSKTYDQPPDPEFIKAMSRNNILMLLASGTPEYGRELLTTIKSLPTGVNAE